MSTGKRVGAQEEGRGGNKEKQAPAPSWSGEAEGKPCQAAVRTLGGKEPMRACVPLHKPAERAGEGQGRGAAGETRPRRRQSL